MSLEDAILRTLILIVIVILLAAAVCWIYSDVKVKKEDSKKVIAQKPKRLK